MQCLLMWRESGKISILELCRPLSGMKLRKQQVYKFHLLVNYLFEVDGIEKTIIVSALVQSHCTCLKLSNVLGNWSTYLLESTKGIEFSALVTI